MPKKKRPSVEKFKEFVREHPGLRNEVKENKYTWQELFEEWYILGSDNERWNDVQTESKPTKKEPEGSGGDLVGTLMNTVKNMDINQIQQYISSANQALGAIQGIITSFQGEKTKTEAPAPSKPKSSNPFAFKKD